MNVAIGKSNKSIKDIKKYKSKNINIFVQYNKIHNLIKKCNIAVVAGGCILWDLLYVGISTVAFCTSSNQYFNLVNLHNKKFILLYDMKKKINNNFLVFLKKNLLNKILLNKKKNC